MLRRLEVVGDCLRGFEGKVRIGHRRKASLPVLKLEVGQRAHPLSAGTMLADHLEQEHL